MAASNRSELFVDDNDDDFFDDGKNRSSNERSYQNNSLKQTEGRITNTDSERKRNGNRKSSESDNSSTANCTQSSDGDSDNSSDAESDASKKSGRKNSDSRKTSSGSSDGHRVIVHAKLPRTDDSDDADRTSESSNADKLSDISQRSDRHRSSKSTRKELPSDDDESTSNKSVCALSKITEESDSLAHQGNETRKQKSRAKSAPVRRAHFDRNVSSVAEGKLDSYKDLLREVLEIDSRYKGSLRPSSASTYSDHFRQYRLKSAAVEIPYRWRRNYTFTDDKVRCIERENQRLLKRIQSSTGEVPKTWSSSYSKPLGFNRKAAAETVRTRKLQEIEIQNLVYKPTIEFFAFILQFCCIFGFLLHVHV